MNRSLLKLGLLAASIIASPADARMPGVPAPELDALFQSTNGWIGADGAFSIPLSTNVTLWIFGDTFLGEIKEGRRANAVMVNNTIGIQRGTNAPEFFHGTSRDGKPAAFFRPESGSSYFWPMHGTRTGDGLWLLLHEMVNVKSGTPFGFKTVGCWLGRVPNPDDLPPQWKFSVRKVPFTTLANDSALILGGGVMRDGDFVYIGGTDTRAETKKRFGHGGVVLARVSADRMSDFKQWRFFGDGQWQKDFRKVTPVLADGASEFSLTYLSRAKKYVAVYMDGGIRGRIVMRLASAPEGPWSEPCVVFRCPELDWDAKAFCYSAKAHPELATAPDELIITYAANSWDFWTLFKEPRLYWPRFVRVQVASAFSP